MNFSKVFLSPIGPCSDECIAARNDTLNLVSLVIAANFIFMYSISNPEQAGTSTTPFGIILYILFGGACSFLFNRFVALRLVEFALGTAYTLRYSLSIIIYVTLLLVITALF
ncbi:hypothetical protein [Neptuniibacter sp. QD37_11]|uniref:hypothetical protein n=1 Tax=Neptuniibacter sp. QD37_11 TaxID=3398209 RepID=UPI0039F5FF83